MVHCGGTITSAVGTQPTEAVLNLFLKLTLGRLFRKTVEVKQEV